MPRIGRTLAWQLGGLLLVGGSLVLLSRFFPLADWIAGVQQQVMRWGAWSALAYPLLYAGCNVLLLPGGVLSMGGGFFFGLWWGFLIVLVGNVGGAAIAFYLSRRFGQSWFGRKLAGTSTFEALAPAMRREGWKIILLSQLHPLFPTSLMNYLYGLTTIRFRTCMFWVAIGQAPGLFLYVYLGTLGQLGLNLLRGRSHPRMLEYWIWIGGFASLFVVVFLIGRIALRWMQEIENAETAAKASEAVPTVIQKQLL